MEVPLVIIHTCNLSGLFQNGVLKSLSFLFEYIGEMGKDYIYAVTPLLQDALMDRDAVHRQVFCFNYCLLYCVSFTNISVYLFYFYFYFLSLTLQNQTACSAIKHMSLGVYGFGTEDALQHLLNYVWPNIFEVSVFVVFILISKNSMGDRIFFCGDQNKINRYSNQQNFESLIDDY